MTPPSILVRPGTAGLVAAAATATAYLLMLALAVAGQPLVFAVSIIAVVIGEAAVARTAPIVPWALARVALTAPWRWVLMSAALLVLTQRVGSDGLGARILTTTAVLAGAAALLEGFAEAVVYWRKSPLLSRNVPLGGLQLAAAPTWLLRWRGGVLWPAQIVLVVGTALSLDGPLPADVGRPAALLALGAGVMAAALGAVAAYTTRASRIRSRVPAAVKASVSALAPDVVLYYGGGPAALYQVEMWLPTMEQSRHRTLVVLRDRAAWRRLGATSLPVICAPRDTVLTSLDLRSAKAALFVANGASNVHLLRMGGMRTAFIGHGDSDKVSSRNPFVKVYDEIWVAGPAGAARYAGEDTTAVAARIRVVGRPQAATATAGRTREPDAPLTVLYAPTWEGWGDEPHHSSLPGDGAAIVSTLLRCPGVRVVYRPHPLTGTRDPAVRRAHKQVVALLRTAGAPKEGVAASVRERGPVDDVAAMLADRPARPDDTSPDGHGDTLQADRFWCRHTMATHRIAEGDMPGLQSCLEHADLLVADVSGVVSDWLGQDRPLAIANPGGLDPAEFARRYPSSRGGQVLGPKGAGLAELVAALARGEDPTSATRAEARVQLLGQRPEAGSELFEAALDRITARVSAQADPA
jgi:hypothetical protein